jgi:hypothetical protein
MSFFPHPRTNLNSTLFVAFVKRLFDGMKKFSSESKGICKHIKSRIVGKNAPSGPVSSRITSNRDIQLNILTATYGSNVKTCSWPFDCDEKEDFERNCSEI